METPKLERLFYLFIITIFFCAPAFYNGFPILFPDTSSYIWTGFTNEVQGSRPWLYSGFVRHTSLWETLWLVVFVQGFLMAGVLYLMFKEFYKGAHKSKLFILYSLIIGTTTAVSFHVSRLMPDIFTPIVVLIFILLLLEQHLNKKERIFAIFLFIIASGMHNAHLIMNVGMLCVLIFGGLFKGLRAKYTKVGITRKKVAWLTLWVVCTHLLTCSIHYSKGGGFAGTKGGSIFLFARLCDFGIAQAYIKEHCGKDFEGGLCEDYSKIFYGGNFLWNPNSFFNKNGGWTKENEAYYGALTKKILKTPKYFKSYLIRSIEATFMQLFDFGYSPVESNIEWVTGAVKDYYPMYTGAVMGSKQVTNSYNQNYIDANNWIQQIVLLVSALLTLLLFWSTKVSEKQKALTMLIILGLLINAFIAAATSGVYNRYQSRVMWLITLPVFLFICNYFVPKNEDA